MAVGERRRVLLAKFADLINRAEDNQALDRIERRVSIIADVLPAGLHAGTGPRDRYGQVKRRT